VDDEHLHLDRGTNEVPEGGTLGKVEAGASVGDRETNADRGTDRTVRSDEAGLGGGLDQAEEARRGVNRQKK